jgi:hypothetical protein
VHGDVQHRIHYSLVNRIILNNSTGTVSQQ